MFMLITDSKKLKDTCHFRLTVNDCVVERETTVINEKLSWDDHIEFLRKEINQRLGVLRRIKHFLPFYARNLFVNTMVLSFLDYCDIIWGDRNNKVLMAPFRCCRTKLLRLSLIALYILLPLKCSWISSGKIFVLDGAFIGLFMFLNVLMAFWTIIIL